VVEDPDFNSDFADAEMLDSPFPAITLANTGDKIVFTGTVDLDGTTNSPLTSGTPRTQFRFGLFDGDEEGLDDNGWVGYYMSNKHGDPGTPSGVLTRKPVGNTSIYLSVTGQTTPVLAAVQGDGTDASLFNDDTYSMNLTIERNAAGEMLLSGALTGVNGFSQMLNATDTTASTLGTYTFDHLGFLLGGNINTDRAAFADLDVTFMPGVAGLAGDFNNDNKVDAADYVIWRQNDGTNNALPNDGGLGTPIGTPHYELWVANFGDMAGSGSGLRSAAVPEPGSITLVALAATLMMRAGRRPGPVLLSVRTSS
jgi:hypothetical protein